MGLKDIQLKESYDSDNDNLINDFYIPTLSNSIKYKRISGFFSSSSLAVAARGMGQFIFKWGFYAADLQRKIIRYRHYYDKNGCKKS